MVLAAAPAAAARLELLHSPSGEPKAGEAWRVDGSLAGDTREVDRVVLKFRGPGEDFTEARMELQYGDLYRGQIPAAKMRPPGVEYYVEAVLQTGARVAIFASAKKPKRLLVVGDFDDEPEPRAQKGKKKKGKGKRGEEPEPDPEPPPDEPVARVEPKPEPEVVAAREPKPEPRVEPKPVETRPEPRVAPAPEPKRSEPPRKRSELEEELAIYGAEDTSGQVTRVSERAKAPTRALVLTHEQLVQRGARFVADALDLMPGLTVSRDVQGFHRLGVRGIRGDADVRFTIDGHALNAFYDAKALWNLPVHNLERIEVVLGPGTAASGLGSPLAQVHLFTNRQDGLRALASAGLYQSFDGHLSAAKRFGGFKPFVDVDVNFQRGQQRPIRQDALETNTIAQGFREPGDPAGVTDDRRLLVNVGGGASFESEQVGTISLAGRFMMESRGALLGAFDTVGAGSQLGWTAVLVDLGYQRKLSAGQLELKAFFDQQSTSRLFLLSPANYVVRTGQAAFVDGVREQQNVGSRSFGLSGSGTFNLPAHNELVAGADFSFQSLSGFDVLTNYDPTDGRFTGPALARPAGIVLPTEAGGGAAARRIAFSLFAQDTWSPIERFSLQLGMRLDLVTVPTAVAGAVSGTALAPGFGPRVGVVFSPVDSLALRANYARGFRVPTPQEYAEPIPNSDANQGRTIGNPALSTASVDTVEVGFEYAELVGDARITVGATAFFENLTNPIVAIDATGNLFPYANRPQGVRIYGVEGQARVELARRSAVWVNASFFRAEDVATVASAKLLTDTPQARFNAGLTIPLGPWLYVDLTARIGAERRNNQRTVLELLRRYTLPGYAVVGAQLRTELLFDRLELGITGQNVFDFQVVDDVPRPDRVPFGLPREGAAGYVYARVDL